MGPLNSPAPLPFLLPARLWSFLSETILGVPLVVGMDKEIRGRE